MSQACASSTGRLEVFLVDLVCRVTIQPHGIVPANSVAGQALPARLKMAYMAIPVEHILHSQPNFCDFSTHKPAR